MALFFCPNCGGKLSDKAIKCPHCNVKMDVLFPKNGINVNEIKLNSVLEHPILGNGIVIKISENRIIVKFEDDSERKFAIDSSPDIFRNVYVKEPYIEEDLDDENSSENNEFFSIDDYDYDYEDDNEKLFHEYMYELEDDCGPDDDAETYEYYYGDDECY